MIPVKREKRVEAMDAESCAICGTSTHFWTDLPDREDGEQVACCKRCGKRNDPADVPTKAQWCGCEQPAEAPKGVAARPADALSPRVLSRLTTAFAAQAAPRNPPPTAYPERPKRVRLRRAPLAPSDPLALAVFNETHPVGSAVAYACDGARSPQRTRLTGPARIAGGVAVVDLEGEAAPVPFARLREIPRSGRRKASA